MFELILMSSALIWFLHVFILVIRLATELDRDSMIYHGENILMTKKARKACWEQMDEQNENYKEAEALLYGAEKAD